MNETRPITIVGGGLAGLALGHALRAREVPVTLYDPGLYPRHRVCGEFIAGLDAATMATLDLAPLLADALRHATVTWFSANGPVRTYKLPRPAYGISRHTLDERLAKSFVARGGTIIPERFPSAAATSEGVVRAHGRRQAKPGQWMGLKVHLRAWPRVAPLEMHVGRRAYVGLSRVEDGRTNVCGLFPAMPLGSANRDLPIVAALRLAGLARLADEILDADPDPASACAVGGLGFDTEVNRSSPDGLSLGDQVALIPPFTGNGMAMALQSAATALPWLQAWARHESSWTEVCRQAVTQLDTRFRNRLRWAHRIHPWLLRPVQQRIQIQLARANLLPFTWLYRQLH